MINYIKKYESKKLKQHPVFMTVQFPSVNQNNNLFSSPAEAISPGWGGFWESPYDNYRRDPPAAKGKKVIISDTDHIWGIGGNYSWVWKSFLRGHNPIFMDPLDLEIYQNNWSRPNWDLIRKNMGYTLNFAKRMDLTEMAPRNDLCSTNYCLANPGQEYLIYAPSRRHRGMGMLDRHGLHATFGWATKYLGLNEKISIDLIKAPGDYTIEWFNPRTGKSTNGGHMEGGKLILLTSPFTGDAVVYIYKSKLSKQKDPID
jgi:hypothetical protein